jgi:exodeoxyribonuclease-5
VASTTELSEHQRGPALLIVDWLSSFGPHRPVFCLAGYAGTGKTHVVSVLFRLFREMQATMTVMAPTNKAVLTLRSRGVSASTVHKTLYEFKSGAFHPLTFLDGDLVVIEEGSMVPRHDSDAAAVHGKPILIVGDPMQHPPVGGQPGPLFGVPDAVLTEVTRQAEGNPIIELSRRIRMGEPWGYGKLLGVNEHGEEVGVVVSPLRTVISWDMLTGVDLVVCGTHKTRMALNHQIRMHKFGEAVGPLSPGDRVISNSTPKGFPAICKGSIGTVKGFVKLGVSYSVDIEMDTGEHYTVPFRFGDGKGVFGGKAAVTWWDYGNAVTSHRTQSTEADRVIVVHDWENKLSIPEIYTPITRAKKFVAVYTDYPTLRHGVPPQVPV